MNLINRSDRHLIPVGDDGRVGDEEHDAEVDRWVPTTFADALEQRDVLLALVMERERIDIEVACREGRPDGMSDREREHLERELRATWSKFAAGHDVAPARWQRLRDLGRGEL